MTMLTEGWNTGGVDTTTDLASAAFIAPWLFSAKTVTALLPAGPGVIIDAGFPLVWSGAVNNAIWNSRDQDYFSFEVQSGDTVTILVESYVTNLGGGSTFGIPGPSYLYQTDIGLYLYDTAGFITAQAGGLPAPDLDPYQVRPVSNNTTYTVGFQAENRVGADYFISIVFTSPARLVEGSAGGDLLEAWMGNDTILGWAAGGADTEGGDDTLSGMGGRDVLQGAGGNDRLIGGTDADRLIGGAGADTLIGDNDPAVDTTALTATLISNWTDSLYGGAGNDLLMGGIGTDLLSGGAGDDTLVGDALPGQGGAGSDGALDRLIGGDGNDSLIGVVGERLLAGAGNDTVAVGLNANAAGSADGGDGMDLLAISAVPIGALVLRNNSPDGNGSIAFAGTTRLAFQDFESIWITASANSDDILFGAGNDSAAGGGGADTINGNAGNDTLVAGGGSGSLLRGGIGNDSLVESGEEHRAIGGAGHDSITATGTNTLIEAGAGNDVIRLGTLQGEVLALATGALAEGNEGLDRFIVLGGSHYLIGGAQADTLELDLSRAVGAVGMAFNGAGAGEATFGMDRIDWEEIEALALRGGIFDDALVGGQGADTLRGGGGADTMTGGRGLDDFLLDRTEAQGDVLADFGGRGALAGDRILFTGFGAGATLVSLGANSWRAEGAAGGATFTIRGLVDASDYSFM